jgi:hypothetical protein
MAIYAQYATLGERIYRHQFCSIHALSDDSGSSLAAAMIYDMCVAWFLDSALPLPFLREDKIENERNNNEQR